MVSSDSSSLDHQSPSKLGRRLFTQSQALCIGMDHSRQASTSLLSPGGWLKHQLSAGDTIQYLILSPSLLISSGSFMSQFLPASSVQVQTGFSISLPMNVGCSYLGCWLNAPFNLGTLKGLAKPAQFILQVQASSLPLSPYRSNSHQMKKKICHCEAPFYSMSKCLYTLPKSSQSPARRLFIPTFRKSFLFHFLTLLLSAEQLTNETKCLINFLFWPLLQKYLQTLIQGKFNQSLV